MSSFSDEHGDVAQEARRAPLIRLLLAMAQELSTIADDVGKLGDNVSDMVAARSSADIRNLQTFDLIQQRTQGQATLLVRLTRKMADDQMFDRKRLADLVADIPFESVRASLQAAYEGRGPAADNDGDDAVDWF